MTSKKITTFVFDMGRVLVDFSMQRMHQQIAAVAGVSEQTIESLLATDRLAWRYECGQVSSQELYERLAKVAQRTLEFAELQDAAGNIFSLKEDTIPILEELKRRGHTLAILSNTCEFHVNWIRDNFEVLNYFDHRFYSYELGVMKPDHAIYEKVLQSLNVEPATCFFTDDLADNIAAAKALGFHTAIFESAEKLKPQLEVIW